MTGAQENQTSFQKPEREKDMTTETIQPNRITDAHANVVAADCSEPEPGSVVLTMGAWGTAWQRHFNDGRWHSTRGGGSKTWTWLLTKRNMVLVYEAPIRVEQNPEAGGA